jgi:hypothetical protein
MPADVTGLASNGYHASSGHRERSSKLARSVFVLWTSLPIFAAAKIPSAIGGNASQAPKLRREDWAFPNQDSVLFGGTILKKPMQFYEYEVVPLFN